MKNSITLAGLCSVMLAGCYTVSETEFPEVAVTPVPSGKSVAVKLSDYRTGVYNYVAVEGHEMMTPAKASGDETAEDAKIIDTKRGLESSASGRIVSRAIEELKSKGFTIDRNKPEYVIKLVFSGPTLPTCDTLSQIGYMICTLFTAEKNEVTWTAKLEVLDPQDKVLFTKDYEQNYSATIWGPIPVASPACSPKVTEHAASSWALTALADRALADATDYIVKQIK